MTIQKSHIHTLIILKLILISFLFSVPSAPSIDGKKEASGKYTQFEIHPDIILLKNHVETKLIKRLPFHDDITNLAVIDFNIPSYSIADSFFEFHILHSSYNLQSALARAPPV